MKLDLFLLLLLMHILIKDVYYFFFLFLSPRPFVSHVISLLIFLLILWKSPSSPHLLNEETKAQNVN